MTNKRIIDLTTTNTPAGYVAVDHDTNGTKKLDVTKLVTTIDDSMSASSTNPVQNKVINTALSGKLATNGNSQNNTVTFTSGDAADSSVAYNTAWTTVSALSTGLSHANLFNRISQMMKNVRVLYKFIGTTDISSLSDAHTVTGALAKLNTDLAKTASYQATYVSNSYTTETDVKRIWVYREGKTGYAHINLNLSTALPRSAGTVTIGKIDGPTFRTYYYAVVPAQSVTGSQIMVGIQQNGDITVLNDIVAVNASGFYRAEIPVSFTD